MPHGEWRPLRTGFQQVTRRWLNESLGPRSRPRTSDNLTRAANLLSHTHGGACAYMHAAFAPAFHHDRCKLALFDFDGVAACLRRLPHRGRVLVFGDSLARRFSSALAVEQFPSSARLTANASRQPLRRKRWLAAPQHSDGWVGFQAAWRLEAGASSRSGVITIANDTLRDVASGGLDLVVLGVGMHLTHSLVRHLDEHVHALITTLRRHLATPSRHALFGRTTWRWHTPVLWLLPHEPDDNRTVRRPFLANNGAAVVRAFREAMARLLPVYDVPFFDAWALTNPRDVPKGTASPDGVHFAPWVYQAKSLALLNHLCANGASERGGVVSGGDESGGVESGDESGDGQERRSTQRRSHWHRRRTPRWHVTNASASAGDDANEAAAGHSTMRSVVETVIHCVLLVSLGVALVMGDRARCDRHG